MSVQPIIRQFTKDDIEPFFHAVAETTQAAYQWLPWCHPGYSIQEAREWCIVQKTLWEQEREYNFLIVDAITHTILGSVGLNTIHPLHRFAFLGYWVRSSYQGQGIAARAACQAARFGFTQIRLNRIEILMAVGNEASRRAAEKTGALYEGIARKKLILHNAPVDAHVFSLLRQDVLHE